MLGYMMLQQIISDLTPKTSQSPLISIYLISLLCISTATILSIVVCAMISEFNFPMPRLLHLLFIDCLDVVVRPSHSWTRIVRYLMETYRHRKLKQSFKNMVDVPIEFTSFSITHQDTNIESGSGASNFRVNSTNHFILTNLPQTHSQSQITHCQRDANIDDNGFYPMHEIKKQTALPEWEHLAYNICRVAGLICFSAQIIVFVFFFVPLFSR